MTLVVVVVVVAVVGFVVVDDLPRALMCGTVRVRVCRVLLCRTNARWIHQGPPRTCRDKCTKRSKPLL